MSADSTRSSRWSAQKRTAATELYIRGRKLAEEMSPETMTGALDAFGQALALDPAYAPPAAASADGHLYLKNTDASRAEEHLRKAREFAELAVRLDPQLAEAHCSRAAVRQAEWNWRAAEDSYRESLRLNPRLSKTHRWFAGLLLQFGRGEEALQHMAAARELDPYDRALPGQQGLYLFLAGQPRQALQVLEPAVHELDVVGRSDSSRQNLAQVYAYLGNRTHGTEAQELFDKAIAQARTIQAFEGRRAQRMAQPPPPVSASLFALIHSLRGDRAAARPFLERVQEEYTQRRMPVLYLAWIHAVQGNHDETMRLLETAWREHDPTMLYVKVLPFYEPLRPDPRFQDLIRRMGL